MDNIFNFYSVIKEIDNYAIDELPIFNAIEIKDLIISDISLDNRISVNSKYSNVQFSNTSLYSAYFVQTSFQGSNFRNANFTKANLNNTIFTNCSFISRAFNGAEIPGANITQCKFRNCNFRNVTSCHNVINDTQFDDTIITFAAITDNNEKSAVRLDDDSLARGQ